MSDRAASCSYPQVKCGIPKRYAPPQRLIPKTYPRSDGMAAWAYFFPLSPLVEPSEQPFAIPRTDHMGISVFFFLWLSGFILSLCLS